MKNAQLWKRILHEGARDFTNRRDRKEFITNKVITLPIIVDTRESDLRDAKWDRDAVLPFREFWIEGWSLNGVTFGAVVIADRQPDGGLSQNGMVMCIMAGSEPPTMIGQVLFHHENGRVRHDQEKVCTLHPNTPMNQRGVLHGSVAAVGELSMDTLSVLDCKNVSLGARENDEREVRRAEKRFGSSSTGYRYHVLVVRPPGAKSDHPGEEIGTMPRHICRGHFAEYGPEFGKGLLFGKYAGRFYVPPHMKGDKKNGTVLKDYEVRA